MSAQAAIACANAAQKRPPQIGRYMVEVWKAVGMDMSRVEFLNCSEEINARWGEGRRGLRGQTCV
jgi:hypothetical protein